jgi:protease IV
MTKGQKIAIATILAAPIIIGLLILGMGSSSPTSKFSPLATKKIGLVEISDVIYSSEDYVRQLRDLRENDAIAGVILRVDSPGGAVAPSQEIFKEVMKFRLVNKPVVVSMGNLAASGGYYVSCPAYKIFANPGSVTGSIGVILSFPHYYKLLGKIGVDMEVLKSGELKDVGSPTREMTPRERAFLKSIIDDIHMQFIEDVSMARNIARDSLIPIADGRIFTGRQALRARLVDTLGSYEDAIAFLKEHVGISDKSSLVEKKPKEGFLRRLISEELFDKIPLLKRAISPAGSYFLYDCDLSIK